MTAPLNRAEIFRASHFLARWKKASGARGSYAELFAAALRQKYAEARRNRDAAAAARKAFEAGTIAPVFAARVPTFTRYGAGSPLRSVGS